MPQFQPSAEQEAILKHERTKHARILAGPGTGKSATLVALLERLLAGENPPKAKLLTFTRAATSELAGKVAEHGLAGLGRPSTVHSFAISVLTRNKGAGGFPEPLRIADDWENSRIVAPSLARRAKMKTKQVGRLFTELASNWEALVEGEKHQKVSDAERGRFLALWQEHRDIYGYTLLQELPYALLQALEHHGALDGIDYELLIVDEYQDLNACDLKLLQKVAQNGCSLIAAGDDDQSIYSFRRAHPEGIRRFPSDYPGCSDYPLSITRRCGQAIVEWARWVIESDPDRKTAGRARLTSADGAPAGVVALLAFAGEKSEADGVALLVKDLLEKAKVAPSEILILLRGDHNGQFSGPIRDALNKLGIEAADPDAVKRILTEEASRRLLAVLRLLVNRTDSLAWATLLELEPGVGDGFQDYVYDSAKTRRETFATTLLDAHGEGFSLATPAQATRVKALVDRVLPWLDTHPVPSVGDEVWGEWIVGVACDDVAPAPSHDLRELLSAIDELVEPGGSLGSYISQIGPLGKDISQARSECVRIMTMASSKGLTVRATIIAGCEDGIVPRPGADSAEERRLLYVAMTRAKEFLFCTWARSRKGPTARSGTVKVRDKRQPSRFLQGGPVRTQNGKV